RASSQSAGGVPASRSTTRARSGSSFRPASSITTRWPLPTRATAAETPAGPEPITIQLLMPIGSPSRSRGRRFPFGGAGGRDGQGTDEFRLPPLDPRDLREEEDAEEEAEDEEEIHDQVRPAADAEELRGALCVHREEDRGEP